MKKLSLLALTLCLPALAQDGFRVGVELGSMKTTTDGAYYLNTQTSPFPNYAYTYIGYAQPTQKPLSLDLAWINGDDEYSLTYMSTSKSATQTFTDYSNYNYLIQQSFKASIVDLTWTHAFAKWEKGSLAFSGGLRSISGSDELSQTTTNSGYYYYYTQKTSGSGIGLTAGLHGRMNFNDRFWLTTGFTTAMINDKMSVDRNYYNYNLTQTGTYSYPGVQHKSILQTAAYLRLNMQIVGGLKGYLGYDVRNYGSEAFGNFYNFGTQGFGLAGTTLGVSYTF